MQGPTDKTPSSFRRKPEGVFCSDSSLIDQAVERVEDIGHIPRFIRMVHRVLSDEVIHALQQGDGYLSERDGRILSVH